MAEQARPLRVALLGCGSVGSQVVRLLTEQSADLEARIGAPVELAGVAVRRRDARREVEVPEGLLTTDAASLVASGVDVVVEVIGGIEPARSLILSALENGASVVTANKALLAEDGATLFAQPLGVGVARERIQKDPAGGWTPSDWGATAMSEEQIHERLAEQGYAGLAADPDAPRRIKQAAERDALAVWTGEHLVTIDDSAIDARPEKKG